MVQTTIYALQDPRTKEFRYVGASANATARLKQHIMYTATDNKKAGTAAKRVWLTELAQAGLEPYLVTLEVANKPKVSEREKYWIAKLASEGEPLTNREARGGRYRQPTIIGSFFFEIAERQNILGIGEIAHYMNERVGTSYSHQSISAYVNGRTHPKPPFILHFAQAFELNHVEASRLAWIFTYSEEPPNDSLERARHKMEAGKPLPYEPLPA